MTIEIRLLGAFSARRGGREVPQSDFRGRLVRTLIRVLLIRRGQFVSRDVLAQALWPTRLPADPVNSLNVLVTRARRGLGDASLILTRPGGYSFAEDERCRVDAEAFVARVRAGRDHLAARRAGAGLRELRQALEQWAEPLAEDAYEDWAQEYRGDLTRTYLEALEAGAASALALGDPAQAALLAERAIGKEPLRESAHLLLIKALGVSGEQAAALAAFENLRVRLAEELGLDPSPQANELQLQILRGELLAPRRGARMGGLPRLALSTVPPSAEELPFVGREQELSMLGDASPGAPLIVAGSSGAGKTRLLAEAASRSTLPVVAGRAFLPEREEPWALGRTLLREVLWLDVEAAQAIPELAARALTDVLPELDELRTVPSIDVDPGSRRSLAFQGALGILAAAAAGSLLVFVDDLQWADPTSLDLLQVAIRRVEGLGMVVAYRPEEVPSGGPVHSFLVALGELEGLRRIALAPLPHRAVVELVGSEALARVILDETDSTPLAIQRVIRALAGAGILEAARAGGWQARRGFDQEVATRAARTGQQHAVEARTARLPAKRRTVLRLLALAGREMPARALAQAAGRIEGEVLEELDALARAALVRLGEQGWSTVHDSVTEAVASSMQPEDKAPLHARLAAATSDPAEVARHLSAAGEHAAAASAFSEAARRALGRFADEEAISLAEAGLELSPEPAVRAALVEARAEARARKGDLAAARADLREALAAKVDGPDRARTLTRMAELAAGSEDFALADELLGLALIDAGSDPASRAEVLVTGAIPDLNLGRFERAEQRCTEALSLFESVGNAVGVARVLDARAMTAFQEGRIFDAEPAFDRAARLLMDAGQLIRAVPPRAARASALFWMASPEAGLSDADEALDLSMALGHPDGEAFSLIVRSCNLGALGRTSEAVADAAKALEIAERIGHREWRAFALWALGSAWEGAGEPGRAEAMYRESLALSHGMPIFATLAAGKLAVLLAVRGDVEGAEEGVRRAFAEGGSHGLHYARLARAELAAAGNAPNAGAIAAEALGLAESAGFLIVAARLRELVGSRPHGPTASPDER